ncbi:ferritin subunit-like [Anopheles stephensi]|uniref:ferritin subunit-like n=1 Tax=Anopheles stephensi TaxID=30069 RepID=UPI0016588AED|nr:ferritin subunit-like [Anopheles stephensi]XP_035903853.1 ferritin subunit-like [Anopheles stephensi]XP_035903854.1 ferritin subunit-like [Anopheles stephensi]
MMKSIFFGIVALMFAAVVMQQEQASAQVTDTDLPSSTDEWNYMNRSCSAKLQDQINKEFDAALFYMQYAAYFAQYKVNLPGFEKFFFSAASEEREHGMKLIEYALMRGQKPIDRNTFSLHFGNQVQPEPEQGSVALAALKAALAKEQEVTKSIRELIKVCEEDHNDYHLVDYLTGEFLEEQHQGQRDLAGKITMLSKLLRTNPKLGEFMFDKQNM